MYQFDTTVKIGKKIYFKKIGSKTNSLKMIWLGLDNFGKNKTILVI